MNIELREELENVPIADIAEQEQQIEQLRGQYNHSISVRDSSELFPDGFGTYNCFAFAFNLVGLDGYLEVADTYPRDVFANSEFVNYLLDRCKLTEINNSEGIIIYFNNVGKPTHAGKYSIESVISKWGTGLLFEHGIFEVPLNYGDVYKTYQTLSSEVAIELFYDYAESKGRKFQYK